VRYARDYREDLNALRRVLLPLPSGQGQIPMSSNIPLTGTQALPPGRFAVRLDIAPPDTGIFLAAGAVGHGAIYTQYGHHIHIVRKVVLRVGSYVNWLVLKLH